MSNFQRQTPSVNNRSLASFTSSLQVNFFWVYLSLSYINVGDVFGSVGIFEVNTVVSVGYICGPLLTGTC